MFIRNSKKLHELTYKLSENEIIQLLEFLNHKNIKRIGVVEGNEDYIDKSIWLNTAKEYNIRVAFFKECNFYGEKYYILFNNEKEYFSAVRIHSFLNENHNFFSNEEFLDYLFRKRMTCLKEENNSLVDLSTNKIIGNSPILILTGETSNFLMKNAIKMKNIISIQDFNTHPKAQQYSLPEEYCYKGSAPQLKINVSKTRDLINWGILNSEQTIRIEKELTFLEKNNKDMIFWLCSKLRPSNEIEFSGNFDNFLLTKVLGLNSKINSGKSFNPTNEPFILRSSSLTKFNCLLEMKKILNSLGLSLKHPVSFQKPLFSSLLSLYEEKKKVNGNYSKKVNLKKMIFYKDRLDDLIELNDANLIENFYKEMRLYFLLNQEDKEAFEFSMNVLKENILVRKNEYDVSLIFNQNHIPNKGETVFLDINDRHMSNLPSFIWENKKSLLNF